MLIAYCSFVFSYFSSSSISREPTNVILWPWHSGNQSQFHISHICHFWVEVGSLQHKLNENSHKLVFVGFLVLSTGLLVWLVVWSSDGFPQTSDVCSKAHRLVVHHSPARYGSSRFFIQDYQLQRVTNEWQLIVEENEGRLGDGFHLICTSCSCSSCSTQIWYKYKRVLQIWYSTEGYCTKQHQTHWMTNNKGDMVIGTRYCGQTLWWALVANTHLPPPSALHCSVGRITFNKVITSLSQRCYALYVWIHEYGWTLYSIDLVHYTYTYEHYTL